VLGGLDDFGLDVAAQELQPPRDFFDVAGFLVGHALSSRVVSAVAHHVPVRHRLIIG